jgi:large subunit ribosomal protein L29
MEAQELRSKKAGELQNELTELLKEQFNLRMQRGMGQLSSTHELRRVRRDIAKLRTVLHEKETAPAAATKAGEAE